MDLQALLARIDKSLEGKGEPTEDANGDPVIPHARVKPSDLVALCDAVPGPLRDEVVRGLRAGGAGASEKTPCAVYAHQLRHVRGLVRVSPAEIEPQPQE